jgi:hypothetical protein
MPAAHAILQDNECTLFVLIIQEKEGGMHDELSEPLQVEIFAASLRADSTDINSFLEVLATKFEGSLPHQTRLTRQRRIFSREHPVIEIQVTLGDIQYRISRGQQRLPVTSRAKVVRGIVLKTDEIPVEQWIEELALSLAQEAARNAQARAALERFLL